MAIEDRPLLFCVELIASDKLSDCLYAAAAVYCLVILT